MNVLADRLGADSRFKAREWAKLVSVTGSAQLFIQVLGIISGIIIIRFLPTKEYAFYTLANTMLATVTVLTDGGIGAGVLARGGKVWQDRRLLGGVINTGVKLRKRFAYLVMLMLAPLLFYLLVHHHASWFTAGIITLSMIPALYAGLTDTLYEIPLKLNQDIVPLQKNQLLANISRFVLLTGGLFYLPFTFIVMLAAGLTRTWANIDLKKISANHADFSAPPDAQSGTEIIEMLKRTMPSTIYYCVSSQITIWLISIFSSTESVAQVGALQRVVGLLSIITIIFNTLIIPRYARMPDNAGSLFSRLLQILFMLFALSASFCTVFYFFPEPIFAILGGNYSGLYTELFMVSISGCVLMISGIVNYLSVSRGWPIPPLLHISVSLIVQILSISLFDLARLDNILLVAIINAMTGLLLYLGYFVYRITRLNNVFYGK